MKNRVYRFENVEVDVPNLRVKVGAEVRLLEPKSFRLLQFLIENPRRALPKDEIMSAVWPDAAVSDNSLTRAITLVRKALDDDPKSPRYIETIPTVGYRFVAEVREEETYAVPAQVAAAKPVPRRIWMWALAVLIVGLLAGAVYWRTRTPPLPPERLVPLTTDAGHARYPALSPDGHQLAYFWDGPKGASPGIYVKLLGETTALRVTSAVDSFPAWSPDGKRIAFLRSPGGGVYSVSPLGGPERKISDQIPAPVLEDGRFRGSISWSPDGKWLVLDPRDAVRHLVVLPADGGEPRPLSGPDPTILEHTPAFSPDGAWLAFARCNGIAFRCDVYVQQFADGALRGSARRVTHQELQIYGVAWSPDSRSLIYSGAHTISTPYLWRVAADGKSEPQRLEIAGVRAFSPAVSVAGHRLAFETDLQNPDIFRYTVGGAIEPLITSTLSDDNPVYSPDGTRIVFCSDRSGEGLEIWTAQADGSNPVQLTHGPGRNQGSPRWSFDGRWILFDSEAPDGRFQVYAVDAAGGRPRQISSRRRAITCPSWGPTANGSTSICFPTLPARSGACLSPAARRNRSRITEPQSHSQRPTASG